jgi:hypothetical protein
MAEQADFSVQELQMLDDVERSSASSVSPRVIAIEARDKMIWFGLADQMLSGRLRITGTGRDVLKDARTAGRIVRHPR